MADETRTAGWYPDPDGGTGERWWNGAGWSDSRRGGDGIPIAPPSPLPSSTSVPPIPVPPAVIYSAENPAPQRPDPYVPAQTAYPTAPGSRTGVTVSVNRNAMVGFITGLIALFFNILYVLGPIAIVFSALGFVKARQLKAQGVTNNLMVFAVVGLAAGVISTLIGAFSIIAFFASLLDINVSSRIGA